MDPANLLQRLGSTVRKRRRELKLSQEQLAERSGLHRNYIGGVERGERNVGFINLCRIASGLELSLAELFSQMEKNGNIE